MLPRQMAYRIVAVLALEILAHIAKRADTDRMMSFNATMVAQLLAAIPGDRVLGKPLPAAAAAVVCRSVGSEGQKGGPASSVSGRYASAPCGL